MKKTFCCGNRHKGKNFAAATRLAEDRHATWVAPKCCNVFANPRQHSDDVQQARVSRADIFFAAQFLKIQIAINVQPVIMGDHNNIVISREAFAIVGKEIMPAAAGTPPCM